MEAPSDPVKHRGAPGWFPPDVREWLFAQAKTEEFKNVCLAFQDGNGDAWDSLKDRLREAFDAKYGSEVKAIKAAVSAREEKAKALKQIDPEVTELKKRFPYGYEAASRLIQFWHNRRKTILESQSGVSAKAKGKEKAPTRLQLPTPRSPRKVYHDTFRKQVSDNLNNLRKEKGIHFHKHLSMLTTDLNDGYNNAPDEVRQECERIANEERDLFSKDHDVIYVAQEFVQEYVGRVINGLVGKERGQVGNMWFHGIGAYRDKEETLKFFSVDTAFEERLAVDQAFSRQPFYPEFFQRAQRFAADRVQPNNVPDKSSMILPAYDLELVSPVQQRNWLLAHIEGHYMETFRQDLPVPWDAIAANPDQYLIAPPTTFEFGDPLKLPLAALPSIAEYLWSNPSFFKVPQVEPLSDGETPIPQGSQSLPGDGVDVGAPIPQGSKSSETAEGSVHPRKRRKVNRKGGHVAAPSFVEPESVVPVQKASRGQGSAGGSGSGQKRVLRSTTSGPKDFVKRRTLLASGPKPVGRPGWDYVAEDVTPPASAHATPCAIVNKEGAELPSASITVPAMKKGGTRAKKGAKNKQKTG
ncbi:hypothetical protein AAF712_002402 [Marasmius tenuissimus]|uniref:Uncharacterized protein n=1 Tax=Marasmius tenuissimus TaxID=585030 RepID=A0ABR3AC36_9AGAR